MADLISEWREIIEDRGSYTDDGNNYTEEAWLKLKSLYAKFDCQCCGEKGGTGFAIYPKCHCLSYENCENCSKCYEHCQCFTRGEILAKLRTNRDRFNDLINQANKLAVDLGLNKLKGHWTIDDLYEHEKLLRIQTRAVSRLIRRFNAWESLAVDLGNLGDPETQSESPDCGFNNPPYIETDGGYQ